MTWGKHFKSLYAGSMIGSGAIVFAVWGYVIGNMDPSREHGATVHLNELLLGPILGEATKDVAKAIEFLCSPDVRSTSPEEGGRRLIKLGPFLYQVVNGARYQAIRNEEERKAQLREAQQRFREKRKLKAPRNGKPLAGETLYEKATERGDGSEDQIQAGIEGSGGI